jgi:hypothetical protein
VAGHLHNRGSQEITIKKIHTTCGCTEATVKNNTIQVQGKSELSFVWEAGNLAGPTDVTIHFQYQVAGKDKFEKFDVHVTANVVNAFANVPKKLDFDDLDISAPPKKSNCIAKRGDTKVEWDEIRIQAKQLPITVHKLSDDSHKINITINSQIISRVGTFYDELQIRFYCKGIELPPLLTIPVNEQITSPHAVAPASIYLGVTQPEERKQGNITVKLADGFTIERVAIESLSQGEAAVESRTDNQYRIAYSNGTESSNKGESMHFPEKRQNSL